MSAETIIKNVTSITDVDLIGVLKAVEFGVRAHGAQKRKTGAPYIVHPIDAAQILVAEGGVVDLSVLQAAVLHDVVEDTSTGLDAIRAVFGDKVASIVAEVTDDKSLLPSQRKQAQIDHIPHISREAQLVKLADKLSNLRATVAERPPSWTLMRTQGYAVWCHIAMRGVVGVNVALEKKLEQLLTTSEFEYDGVKHPLLPSNIDEAAFMANYYAFLDKNELARRAEKK